MTIKPNCIIAARGGSKRIPNKNIIKIFGQPMISYPITTAIKSKIFKNIFVSTDSKKIKIISEKYGAKVPFLRKKKLANDKVGLQEVLVDFIKSNNFYNEEFFVFIYATAILVDSKMILKALKKFKKNKSDYLIGVQEFKSNPLRALKIKKNKLSFVNELYSKKNTNKLSKFYHDAGSFFIFRTKTILKTPKKLPPKTTFYLHKKFEVCDIDDKDDLKLAKILLNHKINV